MVYPVRLFSNLSVGSVFPGVNRNGSLTLSLIFRNWQSIIFSGYYDPLLSRNLRLYTEFQCPTMPGASLKICGVRWVGAV